jgi:hypothetical protein
MQWWVQLSEMLRNLAVPLGGIIALWLAWLRVSAANRQAEAQIGQAQASARQADTASRKHAGELFQQSVGQLRDEKLEIRLLAIYNLRQLLNAYPEYTRAVIEVLTAYVRENSQRWGDGEPPLDIREIFKFLEENLRQG